MSQLLSWKTYIHISRSYIYFLCLCVCFLFFSLHVSVRVLPQTCTSAFATRDRLRAHLIRHEEKVPCHICGKLLSAAYITDHMRVHNQSQHHACHLCNRSESLRRHNTTTQIHSDAAAFI